MLFCHSDIMLSQIMSYENVQVSIYGSFVKYLCSSFQILSQLFALLLKSIQARNHVNGNDRRSSVKKK